MRYKTLTRDRRFEPDIMRVCSILCLLNAHSTLDWRGLVALPRRLDRRAGLWHGAAHRACDNLATARRQVRDSQRAARVCQNTPNPNTAMPMPAPAFNQRQAVTVTNLRA